jgi:hydrogenase maturation protein HypF
VFQNRRLTDAAQRLLEQAGFRVHLAEALPCSDAGIAFGQIVEAAAAVEGASVPVPDRARPHGARL